MSEASSPPQPPRASCDILLLIVIGLAAANFLALAPYLVYHDLNLNYPFMMADSWDWVANGLNLAGHEVRYSVRAPFLPLVVAALDGIGLLSWLPVLIQIAVLLATVVLYLAVRRESGPHVAFAAALFVIANESWRRQSLDVAADVLVGCLIFLALAALQCARTAPRWYVAAGVVAGLSAITQQVGLLVVAAAAVVVLLGLRREHLRACWLWFGALLLGLPFAGWTLWKWIVFGTAGDAGVRQWAMVRLHSDAVFHYAWALAGYLGVPGLALAVAGALATVWRSRNRELSIMGGTASAATLLFFALLYEFRDGRFLAVAFLPLVLLMAEAVHRLRRPLLRWGAVAVVCIWGAQPLPSGPDRSSLLLLWPFPSVVARAESYVGRAGDVRLVPGRIGWDFPRDGERLARLSWVQAERSWHRRNDAAHPVGFDVTGFGSVAYVDDGSLGSGRYRTLTQLGNALRRRVKIVPLWWWKAFRGSLSVERLGEVGPWLVASVRLPGVAQPFLLAADGRGVEALFAGMPVSAGIAASGEGITAAMNRARAVANCLGTSDRIVATVEPRPDAPDPLLLYFPFFVVSTELRLMDSNEAARAPLSATPRAAPPVCSVEGVTLTRASALGLPVTVVRLSH